MDENFKKYCACGGLVIVVFGAVICNTCTIFMYSDLPAGNKPVVISSTAPSLAAYGTAGSFVIDALLSVASLEYKSI